MKEIFEVWLGVFFLALLMVGGMSIISAGIDARNADATKTNYVAEIQNSNFSASVIDGVMSDAAEDGYDVTIDLYRQDASGARSTTIGLTTGWGVPDTSDVYMAKVNLSFDYAFSLLNVVSQQELVGYAR